MKIYGNMQSSPCAKVRYVAEAVKADYEWVDMDFEKLKEPDYLNLHPAGKVPCLHDDQFILFESSAIIRYLAADSDLYPKDLQKRAAVDQWMDFCQHHVGMAVGKVAFNRLLAKNIGVEVDERSIKEGLTWCDRYLPIIDKQLASDYLTGDLSLADFTLYSAIMNAEKAGISLEPYQNIVKWKKNFESHDFYKNI